MTFSDLKESAAGVLDDCLALKRKERLLVVTDEYGYEVARALWEAAKSRCKQPMMVMISPHRLSSDPLKNVKSWFSQFDAVITTFKYPFKPIIESDYSTRLIQIKAPVAKRFHRLMNIDWKRHGSFTRKCAALLSSSRTVQVKCPNGSDITFTNSKSSNKANYGVITSPGAVGVLPAGCAEITPQQETLQGTIVLDNFCGHFPLPQSDSFALYVENGSIERVQSLSSTREIEIVFQKKRMLKKVNCFGAGTHLTSGVKGCLNEHCIARGAVYFLFGERNGSDEVILPVVLKNASVWLDGRLWIDSGNYV
ncbi:hypothetical protein QA601_09615 [Chitinispirillales bacterium ANBcel5]|uniref:hypothetical protein n=1 Tax=Cellulosispirillum alkaliphilum TaxID=3039283 RepID=UPI002A53B7B8|nr:hypothetical protein [Chitinispirillales bacterium ANBcel5]